METNKNTILGISVNKETGQATLVQESGVTVAPTY